MRGYLSMCIHLRRGRTLHCSRTRTWSRAGWSSSARTGSHSHNDLRSKLLQFKSAEYLFFFYIFHICFWNSSTCANSNSSVVLPNIAWLMVIFGGVSQRYSPNKIFGDFSIWSQESLERCHLQSWLWSVSRKPLDCTSHPYSHSQVDSQPPPSNPLAKV